MTFSVPLLSIGGKGSPYNVAFGEAYSLAHSNQLSYGTGQAPGWGHNYEISLAVFFDPFAMIGSDLTGPAIPGVKGIYYLLQNANQLATYYAGPTTCPLNAVFDSTAAAV